VEVKYLKVAVSASAPSLDAPVDPRFGRCAYFVIVDPDTMQFEVSDQTLTKPYLRLEYKL